MEIDGIVLDVDGTLWDTTDIVAKAWNQAIQKANVGDIVISGAILKKQFGKTMNVIGDNLFGSVPDEERSGLLEVCCRYEHDALSKTTDCLLYPSVRETLQLLSRKYKLFIVSNCQAGYIELFLEKNRLEQYITDTECYGNNGNDKGTNMKLIAARHQLHAPVYVGDTMGDQEAAEYAGIPFIFASYGFGTATKYVARIEGFSQLASALPIENRSQERSEQL